ncbi:MAG: sugar transferase [Parcubacteria group bacterium]|nr:sugar transferase [Parcubacteria group bacterium]
MDKKLRQSTLLVGDIILAYTALLITVTLGFWGKFTWDIFSRHLLPFSLLYLVWFLSFYIFGLYDLNFIRPKSELLARTGQGLAVCFAVGLAFFYLVPMFGITPKTNLLISIALFGGFTLLWRRLFYTLFSSLYLQNVSFLGQSELANQLANVIKDQPQLGYRFIKFLNKTVPLKAQLKQTKTNIVIISEDISNNKNITEALYVCLPLKVAFIDLAKAYEIILQKVPVDFVNQNWILRNVAVSEKKIYDKIKRILDILASLLLMAITSPIWAGVAMAIMSEDKGPIFYRQTRLGKDGKPFLVWKFRSMVVDAEKKGPQWAEKKDKRVTKTGNILRRFHLDEFPQLINVFWGNISLTGPRPERPEFVKKLEKEIPHYHLRHLIKPGFTGWAQVKFIQYARSTNESHEKFQHDLYYMKNRAFLLDLAILLKTFQLFFKQERGSKN